MQSTLYVMYVYAIAFRNRRQGVSLIACEKYQIKS